MTRRLIPVPWTGEDSDIAFRQGRGYFATALRASSLQADIRDAELMLGAQIQSDCVAHWRKGMTQVILVRGCRKGEKITWLE